MQKPWLDQGLVKKQFVQEMFAEIVPVYDALNTLMSLGLHHKWRRIAVSKLGLKPGDHVLDICCGTGSFFPVIGNVVGLRGKITGLDFCQPMLDKCEEVHKYNAELVLGDACRLPFADMSFDGITVGWGIRNTYDIEQAHQEAYRVLKPGAKFVSIDMAVPLRLQTRFFSKLILNHLVPVLWAIIGKAKAGSYLSKSTTHFLNREELKLSMERAGFSNVMWQDLAEGNVCIHWGTKA